MKNQKIKFTIRQDGTVTEEVMGVVGNECENLISRFVDKVNQQYSRMLLHAAVKDEGFEVEEEWEMDDNSIELTVTRWLT